MKTILIPALALTVLCQTAAAQRGTYKKDPAFTVHAGLFDFNKTRPVLALGVGFTDGISDYLDYSANLAGTSVRYPFRSKPLPADEKILFEADASLRLKLFTDTRRITPYVSVGAGVSSYGPVLGVFAPLGAGCQFRLGKGAFLYTDLQYRAPLSAHASPHFLYSLGLSGSLRFRKKVIARAVPVPAAAVPAPAVDVDGDGIADTADSCVSIPGVARYHGCPVPDSDGDGVNDEADRCPSVPGPGRYHGCPVPDSDRDGLDDTADSCPFEAGPASNQGCPLPVPSIQDSLDVFARSVFFETGRAVLRKESHVTLVAVARLLDRVPSIRLVIGGHTDSTGTPSGNMRLGEGRARAVLDFLVAAGISGNRLAAVGYGATVPVAPNRTAAGRAANRRVEFKAVQN